MKQINEEIIKDNLLTLKENNNLLLVLKDNAYGFGLTKIAKIAYSLGITSYCVKNINEAILLKKKYPNCFVLILGTPPRSIKVLKKYNICVSIFNMEDYFYFSNNEIEMHLEINLGMNRYGFNKFDSKLLNNQYVKGVYFHTFSSSINENKLLLGKFNEMIGDTNLCVHVGGSAMICQNTNYTLRIGKAIYNNSLSFYAKITEVRKLKENETVGYEGRFISGSNCTVAVINVGYVNGLIRENSIENHVYINNKKYYFIGIKCMDQAFVLIDDSISINDDVELLGPNIDINTFAKLNRMSIYEVYLRLK